MFGIIPGTNWFVNRLGHKIPYRLRISGLLFPVFTIIWFLNSLGWHWIGSIRRRESADWGVACIGYIRRMLIWAIYKPKNSLKIPKPESIILTATARMANEIKGIRWFCGFYYIPPMTNATRNWDISNQKPLARRFAGIRSERPSHFPQIAIAYSAKADGRPWRTFSHTDIRSKTLPQCRNLSFVIIERTALGRVS